jgi:cephalosporin hydroxylase
MKTVVTEPLKPNRQRLTPSDFGKFFHIYQRPSNISGLKYRYSLANEPGMDDWDCLVYGDFNTFEINGYGGAIGYGANDEAQEFSVEDADITRIYFNAQMETKPEIVIMEIGVCRSEYNITSTSIFIDDKRPQDTYIGIDINDKSFLNNPQKGVYTIQSPSENKDFILGKLADIIGTRTIDVLMIDGLHSINQVYKEWEYYTPLLSPNGVVIFHDTNRHPGPHFILPSIDTEQYDVYKYLADVRDYGIGVAVKK